MTNKKNQDRNTRVRFAPSPTGWLHFGAARTALFNYLFAKQNKGKFILRIEDTDLERSDKKYEKDIIESLKWLGLNWDEGPFYQTTRTEIYQKYIKQLLNAGQTFWCYHSKEELEAEKKEQMERKEAPRHLCGHKDNPPKHTSEKGIIRFRCSDKKIKFNDIIRGELEFDAKLLGDISIARDEKTPLYNFAVVVDDGEMNISHVIRGEDHISNTPKQILLAEALGFKLPRYAHLPLILGPDRNKLSKRHMAVSISDYKKEGYLPEALINFMVLLGWNSGTEKEIFSLNELVQEFSLERVQKAGAVFDIKRLDWINGCYIRQMDLNELTKKCLPYLESQTKQSNIFDFEYIRKIIFIEQERLKKISEIGELTMFFFKNKLEYEPELLMWKNTASAQIKANLELLYEKLSNLSDFSKKTLEETIMPLTEEYGTGELLWPLRVALSGQKTSPGPLEIAEILGLKRTLKRVREAINKL